MKSHKIYSIIGKWIKRLKNLFPLRWKNVVLQRFPTVMNFPTNICRTAISCRRTEFWPPGSTCRTQINTNQQKSFGNNCFIQLIFCPNVMKRFISMKNGNFNRNQQKDLLEKSPNKTQHPKCKWSSWLK